MATLFSSLSHAPCKSILATLLLTILVLAPSTASAECTCDPEDGDQNRAQALKYKIAAIASILLASAIGFCVSVLGKAFSALKLGKDVFLVIKALAAGVILATGFVHVLPDANELLTSPCLKGVAWEFPWTGLVAMMSAIVVLLIDTYAMSYFISVDSEKPEVKGNSDGELSLDVHTHGHSHGNGAVLSSNDHGSGPNEELLRHRVVSLVLEFGILVHSVIIGISLGASASPNTIKPLVAALTFHQLFEGMGLGGCIAQAKFKTVKVLLMAAFFSVTTPIGIVIGIGISNGYDENSQRALIVEGLLNAASAGILIYMALVDLLAADFMSPTMQTNGKLRLGATAALIVGAGCMSLLAKWA